MATINPYLTFPGNCEEAFNYCKSIFGGEFTGIVRFGDMPPQEGVSIAEEDKNHVMHISLQISKETVLMGSDTGGKWAPKTVIGNNFSLSVNADTKEHADRFFNMLSEGGQVTMPMDKTFWGSYFGMCTDNLNEKANRGQKRQGR